MSNLKSTAFLVVIILALIGFFTWSTNQTNNEKPVIKIGIVAPLSGNYAAYGSTLAKGAEMALSDLKARDTKHTYQLVIEDDGSDATRAVNAANKLINADRVQAIMTVTSGTGNAVKMPAANNKVIHVCDCTDITIGNAPYNFTNLILPADEGRAWLTEAKRRGHSKIAILSQLHPGAAALMDALRPQVAGFDMSIVFDESFDGAQRDYKTLAAKAKRSGADIYLVEAYPPSLDIITKDLMALGVKNISTEGIFTTSPNPNLFEGLWFTDSTLADPAFKDRFVATYPGIRFNARTVPYGYDIFNMLTQSFEQDGDAYTNLKNITRYQGKAGLVTKDLTSTNFRTEAAIWVMKHGEPIMITS